MFYNVENLFDCIDDPFTNDNEFTPSGVRYWTNSKFNKKITNITKVITAAGGWELPVLIGLCEVENLSVLQKITNQPLLKNYNYHIIHKESPDHRGIDVAMLYQKDLFSPENYSTIIIKDENNEVIDTREILHVYGYLPDNKRIHLFVNHWPSRYGGLMETDEKRKTAAGFLRKAIEKVIGTEKNAYIICMGDFNDNPWDESLKEELGATNRDNTRNSTLINLSWDWIKKTTGTLKRQQNWAIFDQFIISKNLLDNCSANIYSANFLLEKDEKYNGYKPFRTYNGYRYNGGFSDHLPILLEIKIP